MATASDSRKISDLAARCEIHDAMDTYGMTEADDIAEYLQLPLEQVHRVQLVLETELPPDDIDDEM